MEFTVLAGKTGIQVMKSCENRVKWEYYDNYTEYYGKGAMEDHYLRSVTLKLRLKEMGKESETVSRQQKMVFGGFQSLKII